jgi:segregation and condensation protein A
MDGSFPTDLDLPEPEATQLRLDLDGFEGPIDLLLQMARDQKVDLTRLSILALADQYLVFVERVRRQNIELAAEYLVMAAWLAYLKSRLLLPEPETPGEEPTGAEMAAALQFQLQRLQAMQDAGQKLMARPQLGRDVFGRGAPEGVELLTRPVFDCSLYDLLKAYADHKRRGMVTNLTIEAPDLYSVDDALQRLQEMLGRTPDWTTLLRFLPLGLKGGLLRRSALASHFVAMLELARQGRLELRQESGAFSPIYLRAKEA